MTFREFFYRYYGIRSSRLQEIAEDVEYEELTTTTDIIKYEQN